MLKYILIIPVIVLILSVNAANSTSNLINSENLFLSKNKNLNNSEFTLQTPDKVYKFTEEMPNFSGGVDELLKFIDSNLKYPEKAITDKTEGRVVLRFIVSKTGEVRDTNVLRSLSPECDAEAIKVVESMPKWTPGKQNGEAVDVYYTLPIIFKLNK